MQNGTSDGPSRAMGEGARMYTAAGEYFHALQALKQRAPGHYGTERTHLTGGEATGL